MSDNIVLTQKQKDLIKGYKQEAMEALTDQETAVEQFKSIVEAAADGTGLEKAFISGLYKAVYKSKVEEILEKADKIRFFTED